MDRSLNQKGQNYHSSRRKSYEADDAYCSDTLDHIFEFLSIGSNVRSDDKGYHSDFDDIPKMSSPKMKKSKIHKWRKTIKLDAMPCFQNFDSKDDDKSKEKDQVRDGKLSKSFKDTQESRYKDSSDKNNLKSLSLHMTQRPNGKR
ncbi:MAG: hypothetical protein MHPSP_000399, partial [Paramarteilia canceri]